jgi:Na+(H+)/acetate symporter ActP
MTSLSGHRILRLVVIASFVVAAETVPHSWSVHLAIAFVGAVIFVGLLLGGMAAAAWDIVTDRRRDRRRW